MNFIKSATDKLVATLGNTTKKLNDLSTQLASGKRINSGKDDPAGLAVVSQLESESATLRVASNNISYGESIVAIADSAYEQQSGISTRMRELSEQAANGTLSDTQRQALNQEYQSLKAESQRISDSTEFNGKKIFEDGGTEIQVGSNSSADSRITLSTKSFTAPDGDISTQAGAQAALDSLKSKIDEISSTRGQLGAEMNRLSEARDNAESRRIGTEDAAGRIRDADIADVVAKQTALKIQQNGTTAVLGQAGQLNANIVQQLLR